MIQETPDHKPLPKKIATEVRKALERCHGIFTTYGGTGWVSVPAADVELLNLLMQGWQVDVDDEGAPVMVMCGGGSAYRNSRDEQAADWYDLRLPNAFIPIAREIMAARKLAA